MFLKALVCACVCSMLKKKPQLPPRPKPPNSEQIEEDLEHAPADDVVFTLKPSSPAGEYFILLSVGPMSLPKEMYKR